VIILILISKVNLIYKAHNVGENLGLYLDLFSATTDIEFVLFSFALFLVFNIFNVGYIV